MFGLAPSVFLVYLGILLLAAEPGFRPEKGLLRVRLDEGLFGIRPLQPPGRPSARFGAVPRSAAVRFSAFFEDILRVWGSEGLVHEGLAGLEPDVGG